MVYEITSFRGGISDYEDKGIPGAFKMGTNLDIRKITDSLSCNQALVAEGAGVITDLIIALVKCSDGNTYGFGDTGKIYKRTSVGVWSLVYTELDGAITGAAEWSLDTGKTYLYYATATRLKRKEIPGLSTWLDVSTVATNLTSATWHTMREAGGELIICNDNFLAMVGYDGSYTQEALNLIPGNIAKTIVERNGHSIVGTYRNADPNKGVNAAIDSEVPLAQVGDDGDLYFADMVSSIPIKRLPGGGKVNPYGITNEVDQVNFFDWEQSALSWIDKQSVGNLALMGVYGADSGKGGIYSYGRKNKNHPMVLNLEYQFDADNIGAIANVDGTLVFSYKSGATYGIKAVDANNKATATYQGLDFKAPLTVPVAITAFRVAEVDCKALPTGTSIEFWYKIDKNGDFVQAVVADGSADYATVGGKKAVFRLGADGQVFEPQLILNPSGNSSPEVTRIKVYFD